MVETYGEWRRHRTIRLGAGLAYYGLFAFVPLLAVSLSLAGLFFATEDVQSYLATRLADLIGGDAEVVGAALADLLDGLGSMLGLGLIGAASLLLTASLLVVALQDAFNTIWEQPVRSGIRNTVIRRLVAFAVVVGFGGVLVVSFSVNAVTGLIERVVPDAPVFDPVTELFGAATSWLILIGVITLLFRYLTDVRIPWRSVLTGATVTALLVAIGTAAIGAYLRRYAATSLLGATGSVFLILLWIYYEAQIVLVGAEFTRVLARASGRGTSFPGAVGVNPVESRCAHESG